MSRYTDVKVNLSQGQIDKIKSAIKSGTAVSIQLSHEDFAGDHVLALTQTQINKMAKAFKDGTGVIIKLSKAQLKHNMKGGFLPALLGLLGSTVAPFLLKTALPALATGALTGLASTGVSKALGSALAPPTGGAALYVKRGEGSFKVVPAGKGLYLSPWKKGSSIKGDGLYMKTGKGTYCDGQGLLLGPDSPFKNVPILGLIL